MKILFDEDKYKIMWAGAIETAQELDEWCAESFGSHWGKSTIGLPDRAGRVYVVFGFHRLAHANWFKLKFDKNY